MENGVVEKKEAAWKEVLGAKDEASKERCKRFTKKKIERLKAELEGVNEPFGRKMNQDVSGNMRFFWKKRNKENDGKVESGS